MDTTSVTLLDKVRQPTNQEAWQRFVSLYTPLLYGCASRLGLPEPDTADLVQEVFAMLLGKLCDFRYDPQRSFRAWLRTVLHNKWRELKRGRVPEPVDPQQGVLADLAEAESDDGLDEAEYRQQLVARGLELVRGDFEGATWTAWSEYAVAGRPAAEVARELGLSTHAVYLAKARVLRRLREELAGLLD
jgi:RNA polymerase sigma-70 factor (ECF subfamily)